MLVVKRFPLSVRALALLGGVALSGPAAFAQQLVAAPAAAGKTSEKPVTAQRLLKADGDPGDWVTHHGDYAGHRFARLTQISRDTVKNLHVAWTLQLGGVEGGGIWTHGGLEGTPIADDGYLYVTDGWGEVYKVDAHGGQGVLLWKMNPKTDHDWAGAVACCGVDNRGAALWNNDVISHTLDGRLVATDRDTGKILWQRQVANPDKGEVITGAPLIVKNLAITGVAGAEYGIRGWIAATDLNTHKEVWRTYTVPSAGAPGSKSWGGDTAAMSTGGGSTWVSGTYDPATNTLYWGVGNPGPDWDNQYRPGNNLFTDSTLALDPGTGKIKWYFQHTPNDPFDYDSVAENVLVNVPGANGTANHLVLEADRNGFAYALNRENGKFEWGLPFVNKVTWTKGLNPKTGKPVEYNPNDPVQHYVASVTPSTSNLKTTICPGNMGGKNWPPTAYNPDLKLWYIPVIESCNVITEQPTKSGSFKPRAFFTGGGPSNPYRITGSVAAVDVTTGKMVGKLPLPYPMLGGMLATPSVIFFGQPDGKFIAADAKTLKPLWQFDTGAGISAPPMAFTVNGKEYIALLVGKGGAWDKWFIDSTPALKRIQDGSMLYVFGL